VLSAALWEGRAHDAPLCRLQSLSQQIPVNPERNIVRSVSSRKNGRYCPSSFTAVGG
jgi:hypothetical protein